MPSQCQAAQLDREGQRQTYRTPPSGAGRHRDISIAAAHAHDLSQELDRKDSGIERRQGVSSRDQPRFGTYLQLAYNTMNEEPAFATEQHNLGRLHLVE